MDIIPIDHVDSLRITESVYIPEHSTNIVDISLLESNIQIPIETSPILYVVTSDIVIELAISCTSEIHVYKKSTSVRMP